MKQTLIASEGKWLTQKQLAEGEKRIYATSVSGDIDPEAWEEVEQEEKKWGREKTSPATSDKLSYLYLMAREIGIPLKSITLFLANVHIYESNLLNTFRLLQGEKDIKFSFNV